MMLNHSLEQKAEFIQESVSDWIGGRPASNWNDSNVHVRTYPKSSNCFEYDYTLFHVNHSFRPTCAWVVPSSSTTASLMSPTDLIKAILDASEVTLETSREKADSAVNSVLVSIYELDKNGFGRSAAQEVMLFVERNLKSNGLVAANRLLELADTSRLSSRSLIGLIRSTARLKDRLPAWKKAYANSWQQVSTQGKNPDTLFVGLPKVKETDASKAAQ